MAYDVVRYYEDLQLSKKENSVAIPDMYYAVYQNIIAINHFKNEAYIFAHCFESENNIPEIEQILNVKNFASYNFSLDGKASWDPRSEGGRAVVAPIGGLLGGRFTLVSRCVRTLSP